jgi:hypothetical protein
MAQDIATLSSLFPQVGDSPAVTLQRMLARQVRPTDSITGLSSAARLGTATTGLIDCRGYKGILITLAVSAVAGVGQVRIIPKTGANGAIAADSMNTTAYGGLANQHLAIYPGATSGTFGTGWNARSCVIGNYLSIDVQNISSTPGDEVTYALYYMLIP